jgi:6-phospho-beta-glucosidase
MKLTILGGAGVRMPFMMAGLVRYAPRIDLRDVWLMDIDEGKLDLVGKLCQTIIARHNAPFTLNLSTDARESLEGADHVIATIRVGGELGRVQDERIALKHGVIGQETTGPGGFAMAMRSVPALLRYCALIDEAAPGAWLHNFTNPAGLVTQAIRAAGFERVVGVCDSANTAHHYTASFFKMEPSRIETEVFGLNHLSWARAVRVDGTEQLADLLKIPDYVNGCHLRLFDPALYQRLNLFPNEYLYYYYNRDRALGELQAKAETRGEQIARWTVTLLDRLRGAQDPDQALQVHAQTMATRSATYMAHADTGAPLPRTGELSLSESEILDHALGYAGVTLDCVAAIQNGEPHRTGLNVPNAGAIEGMRDDDIVEVTCTMDGDGPHPEPIGAVPEHAYLLMRQVKRYERLAAEAILKRDRLTAAEALFEHPLVGSWPLALSLVDAYLKAHREHVGAWV